PARGRRSPPAPRPARTPRAAAPPSAWLGRRGACAARRCERRRGRVPARLPPRCPEPRRRPPVPSQRSRLDYTRPGVCCRFTRSDACDRRANRTRQEVPVTDRATLTVDGKAIDLPVVVGTENERAVDIGKLRTQTGYVTLDPAYVNTASTLS